MKTPISPLLICVATMSSFGLSAYAQTPGVDSTIPSLMTATAFPLVPRLTGIGLLGSEEVAGGDGMLPVYGNNNGVFYIDLQGKTAFESSWLGSIGAGVRGVYNDSNIFGAYVFADRNISPNHNEFWFVSPGIESLGTIIDLRANGYFPTNTKKQYASTDWADNFGVTDFVSFQDHQQFDILMTQDEEVGWGGDAEIGARIPILSNLRAYVGGYHFNSQDASDINGVAGRIEIPVNRYIGVTARDSYDNVQHNTVMVGLRVTLGGVNTNPTDIHQPIQQRLLDPIERNMATLGEGNGEPIQTVLTPVSEGGAPPTPELERDNIWFFSTTATGTFTGSIEDCTEENACASTDFTQETIDGINALKLSSSEINDVNSTSPSFYLAPGTYNSLNGMDPLVFNNDWIFGRSDNFKDDQQTSFLLGAVSFFGINNKMSHIVMLNSPTFVQDVAITINPGAVLTLEKTRVGVDPAGMPPNPDLVSDSYRVGIQMQDATVNVNAGSEIYAYANNSEVVGINATDSLATGSTIRVNDSKISVLSSLNTDSLFVSQDNIVAAGIKTNDLSFSNTTAATITILNSQIVASAIGMAEALPNRILQAVGISAGGNFTLLPTSTSGDIKINVSNSSISASNSIEVMGRARGAAIEATGISALSTQKNQIIMDDSIITSDIMAGTGTSTGVKAFTADSGINDIRINGGEITATAEAVEGGVVTSYGINASSGSQDAPTLENMSSTLTGNGNTITLSGDLLISAESSGDSATAVGVNVFSNSGDNTIAILGNDSGEGLSITALTEDTTSSAAAIGVQIGANSNTQTADNKLTTSGIVEIQAEATGSYSDTLVNRANVIGVNMTNNGNLAGNNTIILSGDTTVNVTSNLVSDNGRLNQAQGVNMVNDVRGAGEEGGDNTLVIEDNSTINVNIPVSEGVNNVEAMGINQEIKGTTGNRNNSVEINDNSSVNVKASADSAQTATVYGVKQENDSTGNNIVTTNSLSTAIYAEANGNGSSNAWGIYAEALGGGNNSGVTFPDSQISVFINGVLTPANDKFLNP